MTTYSRIRFLDGSVRKTVILEDPTDVRVAGMGCVSGIEVDKHGNEVAPKGVDERRRIIASMLISRRTPLIMDRKYGELVPSTKVAA